MPAWYRWENDESPPTSGGLSASYSGDDLLSQGVSPQVPSALAGLTSVFGMGTGGTLPPWSPETGALCHASARHSGASSLSVR